MSLNDIEHWYLNQPEPQRGCFLALKEIILAFDANIQIAWKYKLPFFMYHGKMFCYLWQDKKTKEPYIGICKGKFIEHPVLEKGDRKLMKIIRINPEKDIPKNQIYEILEMSKAFYE